MARTKQERAVRTRESILRAAAEVLDEYGFAGASITKIAERAGATTGAMYFHFKSKEGLAQAVMNAQPDTIVPLLQSQGLQRLVDITLVWSRQLQEDALLRAAVRLAVEQGAFGMRDDTSYRTWMRIMTECLLDARDRGELLASTDPVEVAEFVVGACTGIQLYSQLVSGRADLPERTVAMWRYLLPGIAAPAVAERIELATDRAGSV
ncbi:ScbR family autoregulator-binding transcription factor [Streptomyces sp. NRRL S-118]|uniref:ScbR family autoregulator-binding transcription factor n=1 Tax=Streptomyces sp. NRRL S-118 TaxID=1463881 RepID=UPI0004CA9432|nr:ScbR family autoregulator-binding transcription factor [Streptomyces sp. NRRL S-118]